MASTLADRGFLVGGAYVGSNDYVTDACIKKVHATFPKIDAIVRMASESPQMALRLLTTGGANLLDYLAKVTPPDLLTPAAHAFDVHIREAWRDILTLPGTHVPPCSHDRNARADALAALPLSMGGLGIKLVDEKMAAAFIASLLSAARDEGFSHYRHALIKEADATWQLVTSQLSEGDIARHHSLAYCIPPHAHDLVEGPFARTFLTNHSKRRVQSDISQVLDRRRQVMLERCVLLHSKPLGNARPTASEADVAHLLTVTSKSSITRVLASSLWYARHRIEPHFFVYWCRSHLGLPLPLATPGAELLESEHDVGVARCRMPHDAERTFDHTGMHTCACVAAVGPRTRMHRALAHVFMQYAREANVEAGYEPATNALLMHKYSAEECRNLFPKSNASAVAKDRIARLGRAVEAYNTDSPAAKAAAYRTIQSILAESIQNDKQTVGLRLDVLLSFPNGREIAIDTGTTHHLRGGLLRRTLKWLTTRHKGRLQMEERGVVVPRDPTASPPVLDVVNTKTTKYKPLFMRMDAQKYVGLRQHTPEWRACIVSNCGEFSPHVFDTIERLTAGRIRIFIYLLN